MGTLTASCGWLACSDDVALAPPPVGSEVERDGWVDQPSVVSGSGETSFVSDPTLTTSRNVGYPTLSQEADFSPSPSAIEGDRIYVLSGFAGLVVVDAADPVAPRTEGRYPLQGQPFSLSVQDGVGLAIVSDGSSSLHEQAARHWTSFVARGNRVITQSDTDLGVIDFGTEPPRVSVQQALPSGCKNFDLTGDTLYCARGEAGVVRFVLPSSP
jgi:hypothetical protein